jgi:hydroxypyruvate isomerase
VHVADLPDRSPPHGGGVPVEKLIALLEAHGYAGAVGLEYTNDEGDDTAFGWLAPYADHR